MRLKRKGFILFESISALMISLMIIWTLTYCVNAQLQVLNRWEERVNAHKIILLHLRSSNVRDPVIVSNRKYYFSQFENKYQVKVNDHVYQIEK